MTQREEFEKWFFENGFLKSATIGEKMLMLQAWKAAKARAARPQLIPVSERLPDEDGTYFCLGHDGTPFVCLFRTTKYEGKIWLRSTGTRRIDGITHWMPVPTAPEQNK